MFYRRTDTSRGWPWCFCFWGFFCVFLSSGKKWPLKKKKQQQQQQKQKRKKKIAKNLGKIFSFIFKNVGLQPKFKILVKKQLVLQDFGKIKKKIKLHKTGGKKGGAKLLTNNGVPSRGQSPLAGVAREQRPVALVNFAFLNSICAIWCILFANIILKIFWSISNKSVIFVNGSFILLTLIPPRVPHRPYSPLRSTHHFLQVRCCKQIIYTGTARGSIVRVKAKAGVQGAELLGGGYSSLKLMLFRGLNRDKSPWSMYFFAKLDDRKAHF